MSSTKPTEPQSFLLSDDGSVHVSETSRWKHLDKLEICYFDLETTDFQPAPREEGESLESWFARSPKNRIVEFGAQIRVGEEIVDELYHFINPGFPIPEESSKIHGINDDVVKDKPMFKDVASEILLFMGKAEALCAYNGISFDKPYLEFEMSMAYEKNLRLNKYLIDPYVCFIEIAKDRGLKSKASLFKAASSYGCGRVSSISYGDGSAHRTEPDIEMCATLFNKLMVRDLAQSFDEFMEDQDRWHRSQLAYKEEKKNKPRRSKR